MTMQDDGTPIQEPEGVATRRTTLVTTGLGGTAGTLIGLATHGPAGLFFGAIGTAAVLALEYHGTPEEYATVARHLGPALRWMARQRKLHERLDAGPTPQQTPLDETVPLRPLPVPSDTPQPHDDLPMGEFPGAQEHTLALLMATRFPFSQVLARVTPSLDRLFLGMLPDGTPIFCAAKDLCHVALAGATDGGKSSILRLLLAQLCYAGASVLLLNPHYTRFDREANPPEDWTPFEPYLLHDPMECRKYEVIEFYLKQIATELLPKRLEKYAYSQPLGKSYFVAVEELPAIVAKIKEAPDYLAQILREGRKVGIFLITVAQDFLVSTIAPGGGGAVRDCYRTAYYVGGDGTTAKTLLDVPVRLLPESELGRGTVMLRSSRVPLVKQAQLVRVPYVENQALYRLLGPSTYVSRITPGWQRTEEIPMEHLRPGQARAQQPQAVPTFPSPGPAGPRPLPARLQHVVQVYEPGMSLAWLAGQLGVSEEKAHIWLKEAKVRGLIQGRVNRPEPRGSVRAEVNAQEPIREQSPEESLTDDERRVLEAYRKGAKTGMAIKSVTGIAGTRVNECLHKLGPVLGLIDWQPRQK